MHSKFIMSFITVSPFITGVMAVALVENNLGIEDQTPATTTDVGSFSNAQHENRECPADTFACGSLCCPSPGICSVDVTAKFHCCKDNTFCAANTTNTPVSAGRRALSIPSLYWFVLMLGVALASNVALDSLDDDLVCTSPLSTALPVLASTTVDQDTRVGEKGHSIGQLDQRADCAGVLWKELQMCCVEGTIPHYYTTGERGCCPRALDGEPNAQIEAQCPAAVGEANLKPLGWGVSRSQASRASPGWARYTLSKISAAGLWSFVRADTETGTIASSSTTKEVTATKRQIIGPGCGGFDTNCQQTCPAGWATCETSNAEAVSSHGWTVVAGAVLLLASFLAFVR